MNEALFALLAGFIVGLLFAFLKLPLPAPPVLSGILGIVGIYLGGKAFQFVYNYAVVVLTNLHS